MKKNISIFTKLLLIIIPLVCVPIILVGYISYNTSVKRITKLSKIEQTTKAKAAAAEINNILNSCKVDLELIVKLPVITDYYYSNLNNQNIEAEVSRNNIITLFSDIIGRSEFYYNIRFIDKKGRLAISVGRNDESNSLDTPDEDIFSHNTRWIGDKEMYVSDITHSQFRNGFVVYFIKPIINKDHQLVGEVVIDLDFEKIMGLVTSIRVGEQGYAFLVDSYGRTIAHPLFVPYEYNLSKYPYPRLREFVVNMLAGETGWKTYYYLGEKAAAYAPIPSVNWSLAVTIPIEEFKKEAMDIRENVVQVVVVTLIITVIVITILAYNLLKPIKRMVAATERVAAGDLHHSLPVKSRDEIGTLTNSFNRMIKNLKDTQDELVRSEKFVSLGRLSAGVAHEIRNPLNAMKGAIVYLQRRKQHDPLILEYTQLILEEIDRLNRFVTEFLYFARQSVPNPIPTKLNNLITNTLNLFEERMREHGIKVNSSLDRSIPSLMLDRNQIEQVLMNLFINAMDAMPQGGTLEVKTSIIDEEPDMSGRRCVELVVSDSGEGISQENMKNIFDPFFSTKENGTGLGLPLSLGILENHGALLTVQSEEGAGAVIIVSFPVNRPPAAGDRD